jgi:hypothetical protein
MAVSKSRRFYAAMNSLVFSTFSRDIARGVSRLLESCRPDGAGLQRVHPDLPAAGPRAPAVPQAVWATAPELGLPQVGDTAEHRRYPSPRPSHRVLDLGKGAGPVGRGGQRAEQLAHQGAATVVEALDFAGVLQGVVRCVLGRDHRWQVDDLDVVAVGIEDEGGVVSGVVLRPLAG